MAFLDDLKQGLTDVTKTVYEKSGQFVEVQKLRMKKNSLNSELKATYVEIGKMVYEEKNAGAEFSGPVVQLCQKVDMGLEAIQEVEEQIEAAKESSVIDDDAFGADDIFEEDVTDVTEPEETSEETTEEEADVVEDTVVEESVEETVAEVVDEAAEVVTETVEDEVTKTEE